MSFRNMPKFLKSGIPDADWWALAYALDAWRKLQFHRHGKRYRPSYETHSFADYDSVSLEQEYAEVKKAEKMLGLSV